MASVEVVPRSLTAREKLKRSRLAGPQASHEYHKAKRNLKAGLVAALVILQVPSNQQSKDRNILGI